MKGEMSLWDAEDETEIPKVRDMTVAPATRRDVNLFAERYHYAKGGGNMMWRWGLWHRHVLWGVVAYNLPTRRVCESVFGSEAFDRVWHMGRLVLADHAPKNSESRLISGSLHSIQREHPDCWAVVTYADTGEGHIGYVYQATNALFTGTVTAAATYVDKHGSRRGTFLNGVRVDARRAAALDWTPTGRSGVKYRYVYLLGNRTERRARRAMLRYDVLPYPKAQDSRGAA